MLADSPRDDTLGRRSRKLWAAAAVLGTGGKSRPVSSSVTPAAASVPLCVEAKSPPRTKHGRRRSLFFRRPSKVNELGSDEEVGKEPVPETVIAVDKQLFKLERYTLAAEPRSARLGMDTARTNADVPPSPNSCQPSADVLLQVLLPSSVARPGRPSQDVPRGPSPDEPVSPWTSRASIDFDASARMPFLELLDSRAAPAGHGALAPPTPLPPRRPKPSRRRTVTAGEQDDTSASPASPQRKRGPTTRAASTERGTTRSSPVRLASLVEALSKPSSSQESRSRSGSSATLSVAPGTPSPHATAALSTRPRSGSSASRRTPRLGAAQSRRAGHASRGDASTASRSSAQHPTTPKTDASRRQLAPFATPTFGGSDSLWTAKTLAAPHSPSMDSTVAQAGGWNDDEDASAYSWDFVSHQRSEPPASEYFSAVSRRTEFSLATPGSHGLAGLGLMAGGPR